MSFVITLGNFDGLHTGHRHLLLSAWRVSQKLKLPLLVLTFEPHPRHVLFPQNKTVRLWTPSQKKQALHQFLPKAKIKILKFTPELAQTSARDFFNYLCTSLKAKAIVVGDDFQFGKNKEGTRQNLEHWGQQNQIKLFFVKAKCHKQQKVSSSLIKCLLSNGPLKQANQLLGAPYSLSGKVIRGEGRGKSLNRATANLLTPNLIPQNGVYATKVKVGVKYYNAVTNIGFKPTFGTHALTVESHLLNYSKRLLHKNMTVIFLARLRDEKCFATVLDLKNQIKKDIQNAKKFYKLFKGV